jgi:hypothetical protein
MKYLLSLIIIILIASTGQAIWPFKNKPVSKPILIEETKPAPAPSPTIAGGRELVKGITADLKAAKEENIRLKKSLEKATAKATQAESKTIEVQKAADALKEWGIIQQVEAQKFMEKYNNAVKRYHRLKIIAALIAAAGGILLGLQFMSLAPPPYNLGVPIGGAVLFSTLVWVFL